MRNEILEAALELFALEGFEGASLPRIAEAARTRHPNVLYHFSTKERLWHAAVDHAFSALRMSTESIVAASQDLPPLQTLKVMLRATVRFAQRHPSHHAIILHECRKESRRFEWLLERHLKPFHRQMEAVGAAAVADGSMKPVPTAHITMILVGAITTFFTCKPLVQRLYKVDPTAEEAAAAHADWLIETIFRGLERDASPGEPTK